MKTSSLYKISLRILAVFVTSLLFCTASFGQMKPVAPGDSVQSRELLQTPRRALYTFVYWQQDSHKRPERVLPLFSLAENQSRADKLDLAHKLLQVLDSRGLILEFNSIPNQPSYRDSLTGTHQYAPFESALPSVYLVRRDSAWVFSSETVQSIPKLFNETFSATVEKMLQYLPSYMFTQWMGLQLWQYFALFIWLLLGLVLRKVFEFILNKQGRRLTGKTKSKWDDQLVESIEKPSGFTFVMLFFWMTYTNLQLPVNINYYLSTIFEVAVTIGFIWLLYNLSGVLADYLQSITSKTESKLDDQLVPLIRKTLKIFIVVIGTLFLLQNQGINVASLLAGLGLGGLAFALAARDTLANFFGSVTIFLDKPFQIGDWVKTSSVEGTVEEVGFRSTRIRTFYDSLISVPNAKMADAEVDNLGLREYRRIKAVLNLTYSTTPKQMEAFVEGIKAIIKANDHMRKDFYEVHFNSFGAHSLDVLVYCFLKVPSWSDELQQRHNFYIEILRLAKEVGVEFAFPTQTLHVDSFYGDEPRKVGLSRTEEELAGAVFAFGPDGEKAQPGGPRIYKDGEEIDFGASIKSRGS